MSNLTFPAVSKPYRGFADKVRNWMREAATFVQNSPDSRADVVAQISAFVNEDDSTVVVSGQEITGVAPTGSYVSKVTLTVANGAISAITLS